MSYEHEPNWAKIAITGNSIVCPVCREKPPDEHASEVMSKIFTNTTYEVRHIPPVLTFTCMNDECDNCDYDYQFAVEIDIVLRAVSPSGS